MSTEDDKTPKSAMQEALERAQAHVKPTEPVVPEYAPASQISPEHQSEGGEISKRKPGRPARTHSDIDNTSTNYKPSVERNNLDQALQPTGLTETSVAGRGDWTDFDEDNLPETPHDWKPEPVVARMAALVDKENDSPPPIQAGDKKEEMFPVRLLRNYRPASDRWYPILSDGRVGKQPKSEDGGSVKIMAGYLVVLPKSEAKQLINRKLAERADAID